VVDAASVLMTASTQSRVWAHVSTRASTREEEVEPSETAWQPLDVHQVDR
jgi:hypothetical protein